jgi:hypothetical protein
MIKRDAIRVQLHAIPDKDEWILSANFSIDRGAKIFPEPDRPLSEEIATATAALKEMIFAQLYADLKHDVANILHEANCLDPRDGRAVDLAEALSKLHNKLQ